MDENRYTYLDYILANSEQGEFTHQNNVNYYVSWNYKIYMWSNNDNPTHFKYYFDDFNWYKIVLSRIFQLRMTHNKR
jgi:hypothetical protein